MGTRAWDAAFGLPLWRLLLTWLGIATWGTWGQTLRLSSRSSGRVDVFYDGQWGTICDNGVRDVEANVICRELGFDAGTLRTAEPGTGLIWLDDVRCGGDEVRLRDCQHNEYGTYRCGNTDAVGVVCTNILQNGDLRIDGNGTEGRLEVYYNGDWGTVCDDSFGSTDADVACRQLGYTGGAVLVNTATPDGTGKILLDDLRCTGSETRLAACSHSGWGTHNCGHSEDVGVRCSNPIEGDIRLSASSSGRLEIYHDGIWGVVCGDFTTSDAQVVCRQLEYTGGRVSRVSAGTPRAHVWIKDAGCAGGESRFDACPHDPWGVVQDSCMTTDAGVECDTEYPGMVRLQHSSSGRLEVFWDGRWGTVCDDQFSEASARVVCRQLGYSGDVGTVIANTDTDDGTGPIWLDNVECTGSELTISQCPRNEWGTHNCQHYEDVGVRCGSSAASHSLSTPWCSVVALLFLVMGSE